MKNQSIDFLCIKTTPKKYSGLFFVFKPFIGIFAVVFLISIGILTSSCTTVSVKTAKLQTPPLTDTYPENLLAPVTIQWVSVCSGLDRADFSNRNVPVIWHAVRINLASANIQILSWPKDSSQKKKISLRTFAKQTGADIAVNTTPYSQHIGFLNIQLIPTGIYIANGKKISSAINRYCALILSKTKTGEYRADIIDSQAELASRTELPDYAFGGFWTILRDDSIRRFLQKRDSRTTVGISDSGKTLYILAVEGEKKQKSGGLSFMECAEILRKMGSDVAMGFDGGYSSNLYIKGQSAFSYHTYRCSANYVGFRF